MIPIVVPRLDAAALRRARWMIDLCDMGGHKWWYHGFSLRALHLACSRHGRS